MSKGSPLHPHEDGLDLLVGEVAGEEVALRQQSSDGTAEPPQITKNMLLGPVPARSDVSNPFGFASFEVAPCGIFGINGYYSKTGNR